MTGPRSRIAPWVLTGAALLMGAALLTTVWATDRTVRRASDTLVRGQADAFRERLRPHAAALDGAAPADGLAAILEEQRDAGLRYLALVERDGDVLATAGEARAAPGEVRRLRPGSIEESGDRVRAALVLRAPPGQRRGPARGGPRARQLVIEFEPLIARELRASAARTFALGAVAAGGFLLVALGMVRWFLRRQRLERRLERERRLASLGQMSAVLAHEIRNPLASLKGNAQLLAGALPADDRARARAERVVAEAIRLEALTGDLLEFARSGELHRTAVDPAALVREAAEARDPARVVIDAARAPATWSLDGPRLRQVIDNLLENALAAGDGPVEVRIDRPGGRLAIEVRDHGPGLAEEDLARVFEPFFTRKVQGTGLGLAVARRLVELHGGAIVADNAAGGGARFRLEIPA